MPPYMLLIRRYQDKLSLHSILFACLNPEEFLQPICTQILRLEQNQLFFSDLSRAEAAACLLHRPVTEDWALIASYAICASQAIL
jgi:hypothetical protein